MIVFLLSVNKEGFKMIILGNRHQFTNIELSVLKKKFKNIDYIFYSQNDTEDVKKMLLEIIKHRVVKYIVLNTHHKVPKELIKFLTLLNKNGIKYVTIQELFRVELEKYYLPSRGTNINFLADIKPYSKFKYIQKRLIDYVLSILVLLLTFPIMLLAMYKIKKESPDGDILFKQKRVGKDNKDFVCYKFRSMRTDVDYQNNYTQEDDPRIFPWGKIMRQTRIDELPQIFNVLKGDMHFIGPRAEWNILVEQYEKKIPCYNYRHSVKPGITGWAQVKYKYGANVNDAREKLMYDLYYIKNWSISLEIKTLFKTVAVVLGKEGV